ncbi:hypothetical protein BU17DRAFT_68644 [Hysterangium stoloniferum]|nr:hypothetical protein BU17DRAFT_68644 [Hysterangium stoloniferum]
MPITTDSLPNTYGVDTITHMTDAAGLPPTSPSAAVTFADSQLGNQNTMRVVNAYKMLHEQWGCDEPGHDLCLQGGCYIGHIQLSQEQISIWIDEICRGQATCHYPPEVLIIPDGSGANRKLDFDWGASETNIDPEPEIEPGKIVDRLPRPSAQSLGIILQETVDLMRPSYPPYIREQASNVFVSVENVSDAHRRDDCPQLVLEWLGWVFRHSGYKGSPEIMSALYRNLTSAPLHIHYDEVLSNFVVILARYHTGSWERDHIGRPSDLAHLMRYLCGLQYDMLSAFFTELTQAMPDPTTQDGPTPESLADARFHVLSEALLDIALGITVGGTLRHMGNDWFFWSQARAVNRLFEDREWYMLDPLASIIKTIISLISTSPDPEFSCGEIQAENVVNAFVDFFLHFDPLHFRHHPHIFKPFSRLKSDSHSLLLLIANPFTGPSVLSSSHCMSILKDNGWVENALSPSN